MKELKYNSEMQRAKDEGRKTQTRRVLEVDFYVDDYTYEWTPDFVGDGYEHLFTNNRNGQQITIQCPYGKIGDTNNGCLITDIRVEQLWNISEEDAKAEGVEIKPYYSKDAKFCTRDYSSSIHKDGWWAGFCVNDGSQFRRSFRTLWESIYPNHPTKAWELNPYVWVITFKKVNE